MSEFSGYEKMSNSFKKLNLDESVFSALDKLKWVVTEKVHGANFSFVYENGQLKFAKRKEYLQWKDDFFGFQLVVSNIEDQLLQLFESLSTEIVASKFMVYGELFGGKYPHPDATPAPDVQAIQTGVYYLPGIHFCAFDIAIEVDDDHAKQYLDYETATSYFKRFNIYYAKPLFIGKLTDALNFNIRINSQVPAEFGMPEIKDNLIEGVVIKPYGKVDPDLLETRPIIKLKNPEFAEEDKFHEAEKWNFIPDVTSKAENLSFVMDELRHYITLNRMQSAISKIGALDAANEKRVNDVKNEFFQDVLADFNENNKGFLENLSLEDMDWISERVKAGIEKMLRHR